LTGGLYTRKLSLEADGLKALNTSYVVTDFGEGLENALLQDTNITLLYGKGRNFIPSSG
jgi:hypothetical protein